MAHNISKVWTIFLGLFVLGGICVFADIALGIVAPPVPINAELLGFTQAAQQSLHIIEGLVVTLGGMIVYIFRTSMKALQASISAVATAASKTAEDLEHVKDDLKDNYLPTTIHDRSCPEMRGKVRRETIKQVSDG